MKIWRLLTTATVLMGISLMINCSAKYFSEYGQDKYIHENIFKNKQNGVFIDIGAHNGIKYSNTYFFEKNLEWTGLCIEPIPFVFQELKKNRNCICMNLCVTDYEGKKEFLFVHPPFEMLSGLVEHYPPHQLIDVNRILKNAGMEKNGKELLELECRMLSSILEEHGIYHIDYLSLDTEGNDFAILKTIDFNKFYIDIIDIEISKFDAKLSAGEKSIEKPIRELMEKNNYQLIARVGEDLIYRKKTKYNGIKKVLPLRYIKTKDWSLSQSFLKEMVDLFGVEVFVESGTFFGTTAGRAAHCFKQVHTIELSPILYAKAVNRLQEQKNIHVYCGDSSKLFPKILPTIRGKILFWLDGHYSEGHTAKGDKNTPIIEELEAIKQSGIKDAVILIDDIRCFQEVDDRPENQSLKGYPSVAQLEKLVLAINKDYQFYIYGDTALAYPKSDGVIVSPVVQACTISRFSEDKEFDANKLVQAEKIIAHAQGLELETIKTLCTLFRQSAQRHGIAKHYYYWYSLINSCS